MLTSWLLCSLLGCLLYQSPVQGLNNGLALKPPMGWMSWQRFRRNTDCETYPDECISEQLIRRHADLLVSEGYAHAGYEYVMLDDGWFEQDRDYKTQKQVPDRKRFSSGMKALADHIHDKGLKFGLFQNFNSRNCDSYYHMTLDAQTFADWGVDYVKESGCYANKSNTDVGYPTFGRLLNETGRPMVYSCNWHAGFETDVGEFPDFKALKQHCNLWRNLEDIQDSLGSVFQIMDYFAKNQDRIQPHAGPGHWNDPDMLLLGNYGLSYDQSKLQMAIWAILAAPLIMSNDLSKVRPEIKDILQNSDVIAVNQDELGIQGRRLLVRDDIEVWSRPISPVKYKHFFSIPIPYYSYALAFVSRRIDGAPYRITFTLKELGLHEDSIYSVQDLFDDNNDPIFLCSKSSFTTRINPNGVTFYKFTAL